MEQTDDSVYYDSNSQADENDEDDDSTFQDAIQVEDVIDGTNDDDATIYGETINNNFIAPVGTEDEATGRHIAYTILSLWRTVLSIMRNLWRRSCKNRRSYRYDGSFQ